MDIQIEKAEQQLIGFIHAKSGYDLKSLISGMGLTVDEWEKIKSNGMYIPADIRAEIEEYTIQLHNSLSYEIAYAKKMSIETGLL